MAISTVTMNSPGVQQNLAGSYGYRCLSQRSDGILVYCYISWNGSSEKVSVLYSYDLGLTWTQRVQGVATSSSETHTSIISNGDLYHLHYTGIHNQQSPCDVFTSKVNINIPFLWDAEFDYSSSQIICTMVDDEDNIHVIFKDNVFHDLLYYTVYNPSTNLFSLPETFTSGASGGTVGIAPDNAFQMAMDSTGKIHVLYIDSFVNSPGAFYQTRSVAGVWSAPIGGVASTAVTRTLQAIGSNHDVSWVSMVIDGNDDVHIVYSLQFNNSGTGILRSVVDYGKFNGSTFDRTVIYEVDDRLANASIISCDNNDKLHIVYRRNKASGGTAYDIFLVDSSNGGTTWSAEQTVISGTTEAYYPFYLFKTERNVPGYNILNSGCAGVYGINALAANSDLYYFYTSDIDYKFAVTGSPDFCEQTLDSIASTGCVNLAAGTFDGLDHLNGEEVGILADGIVLERQTVDGGSISLASDYGIVHIGLPYNSDFETLNLEVNQ